MCGMIASILDIAGEVGGTSWGGFAFIYVLWYVMHEERCSGTIGTYAYPRSLRCCMPGSCHWN
jgi:hypothetical protein